MHNYHQANEVFMLLTSPGRSAAFPDDAGDHWGPGALLRAMQFLEGGNLYSAFNFDTGCIIGCTNVASAGNLTVRDATVSTFLCPSDPQGIRPGNNYAVSYGPQFRWDSTTGLGTGMFHAGAASGIRDCTDGTSNTVAASEKIKGDNSSGARNGAETIANTPWAGGGNGNRDNQFALHPTGEANLRQMYQICDGKLRSNTDVIEAASQFWATARNYAGASFSMMQTPNSRHADCGPGSTPYAFAIVGARSRHPGGVNVLFADGSVRFVKSTINERTWWHLGTKAGGEVVSADAY
jgi:prepilin-type processing-associated H-X9-DG protein